MTILVTGGAGFIGSNFIESWFSLSTEKVINLDSLNYAANIEKISQFTNKYNYEFIKGDIGNEHLVKNLLKIYKPTTIINFAAETHVDTSIKNPNIFIKNNVVSFFNLINISKEYWNSLNMQCRSSFKFIQISTDEIYGSLKKTDAPFTENSPYKTNNPYSASKASANHIAQAFFTTYGFPTILTICTNNYGPYQFVEKFIPNVINSAINNQYIPIYGNGEQIRDWIYVKDHCNALIELIKYGTPGESYNIGNNNEVTNIKLAIFICDILDELSPKQCGDNYKNQIKFIHDRPGHDVRYSINANKIIKHTKWIPIESLESGMRKTIYWYLNKKQEKKF
ncbi:dTDP-glucose 4,6-dehydratase [Candidatus Kinetoplastibacterium desouzaii TCC079E]|uniref:dTDP-glucose 4,6-dehydratase n=1 Tax=Candidatus Kinetoplastidibacterium desouzai TCC079E TaxID=1208919 RepID=M1L1S8_9PROT|nr:dTDP-glucose 4,6-dehydratase [Candidatus Kinetoplastibacterium desouzaii]AGF46708.1 dTDP-glucose 4,6-dehydratase [Candidatus Kinetoplastibacterium desouzaii TCC079E]